ncbi:MAG: hypothetical protein WBM08_08410 [Prochlorococcaceae cyanobacterium]
MPCAPNGLQPEDPTIAERLKPLGYATGQFAKNHLGDLDKHLPTMHGDDEFFGNLHHLNVEEDPEDPDDPKNPAFKETFGPRGVLHSKADGKGGQIVTDTGPLTKKRMETIDDEALVPSRLASAWVIVSKGGGSERSGTLAFSSLSSTTSGSGALPWSSTTGKATVWA